MSVDAIVVGGGPNGLAAAITLARAGRSVRLVEAGATVGGGCRSAELTLPGFVHDVCSAVHPLARGSPVFSLFPLERYGLRWLEPHVELAHPLDDEGPAIVDRDIGRTAGHLGADAQAYARLVGAVASRWEVVARDLLGPLRVPRSWRSLRIGAALGLSAIRSASALAAGFRTRGARALVAGCAAHSMLSLSEPLSGGIGILLLASAHAVGWPLAAGGSQRIADALAAYLVDLGGEIVTGERVGSIDELSFRGAALLDLAPRQIVALAGDRLLRSRGGARSLDALRRFRHGPGVFKIDLALDSPIPWRDPEVRRAVTVHVGGSFEEIARSERAVTAGRVPDRPFVLLAQPSILDPARAPPGRHTAWAYCHVPNGCTVDMTEAILLQIERFAPGFRARILAVSKRGPLELERYNPNYVGGDIGGGRMDLGQLFTRPTALVDPYATSDPRILVCSASTPPGPGVHGLCGWYAASSALRGPLARPARPRER